MTETEQVDVQAALAEARKHTVPTKRELLERIAERNTDAGTLARILLDIGVAGEDEPIAYDPEDETVTDETGPNAPDDLRPERGRGPFRGDVL